ncbi:major facilitator superfamily transporter [Fusarium albosuccineum]|uniref:Major facilitator superfamily transporter n=1 Tax=Fusarium albosuccineum TaxID=1237068 RepID=A0A8H4P0Z8_9HYPO|nr:major facilitator superfamily transporter [Fusarium albosuccineum]
MSAQKPTDAPAPGGSVAASEHGSIKSKGKDGIASSSDSATATPALAKTEGRMEAALGDAILRFLRIRKTPKNEQFDPDAIATQPSIWDSENIEEYKTLYIHSQWENWSAFDPNFRRTWREENAVRRKVD